VGQVRLDLDHARAEKLEGRVVLSVRSLEVKADLETAIAGVVPRLVMKPRAVVVQLHQTTTAAAGVEAAQGQRQPRLHSLAQPAEELRGGEYCSAGQLSDYGLLHCHEVGYVPTVTENEGGNRERTFDIYSRLLKDRIILIGRPIDDIVANLVVAQLIYLSADDPEKEIQIYVNSPGGSVSSGFAIYDTMQYVQAPISTVCIGRAASFGTVVLMAGAKGRRFSLPSSNIHMHQPLISGRGLQGQASDLDIHAREIIRIRGVLNELIAKHTGQPLERVERDTDRDFFLTPQEAVDYGLIDGIIQQTSVPVLAATKG
jgi:ATP-dependent Clp protease protease subunit